MEGAPPLALERDRSHTWGRLESKAMEVSGFMNPDGTHLRRITTDPGDDQAAWSPGGSEIAFNRYRHLQG